MPRTCAHTCMCTCIYAHSYSIIGKKLLPGGNIIVTMWSQPRYNLGNVRVVRVYVHVDSNVTVRKVRKRAWCHTMLYCGSTVGSESQTETLAWVWVCQKHLALYSVLQLRWKIIFPFLAKSRAHAHTLPAYGHETLQGMGK